jgi:hypothetical protein
MPTEYQQVLTALGKQGDYKANVHDGHAAGRLFLHYWGTGPADKLATGFKAAVSELGKAKSSTATKQ